MAGSEPDEDESILEISQQTRRPKDVALPQQRIPAWHPYLDPWLVVVTLLIIGIVCIPVGFKIRSMSNAIVELTVEYDAYNRPDLACSIERANADKNCTIEFEIPRDMDPPILVYYKLTNFYQNHRTYARSRDVYQLAGGSPDEQSSLQRELCKALNIIGGIRLYPCGLIANTMFNDVITLRNAEFTLVEEGIAWTSDLEHQFKQPEEFKAEQCPGACDTSCCEGDEWSCYTDSGLPYQDPDGVCWRFYYPFENTTQYLYETYPKIVSPLEGVTNEHFVVWMRLATLSTFRKLYGYIEETIPAGTTLTFDVNANFEVGSFEGSKSLVITTNNRYGGKNIFLGPLFYGCGFFCLGAGLFFGFKQLLRPRKVGDKRYLHYKED